MSANQERKAAIQAKHKHISYFSTDYVWGTTFYPDGREKKRGKIHIIVSGQNDKEEYYRTLCGIDDVCGHWEFAAEEWFDSEDGCKRCMRKVLEMEYEQRKAGK